MTQNFHMDLLIENDLTMFFPVCNRGSYSLQTRRIRLRPLQKATILSDDIIHAILGHLMEGYETSVAVDSTQYIGTNLQTQGL